MSKAISISAAKVGGMVAGWSLFWVSLFFCAGIAFGLI